MYHERRATPRTRFLLAILALLCAAALAWGGFALWQDARGSMRLQALQSVRSAVMDAAVQCYVLEGAYPRSLAYLEENYGVQINHSRFIVSYEVYASNQTPEIAVFERHAHSARRGRIGISDVLYGPPGSCS